MGTVKTTIGRVPFGRGTWSEGATYYKQNVVFHKGSTYMATVDSPSGEPSFTYDPLTGAYAVSAGWSLIAVGAGSDVVTGKAGISDLRDGAVIPALADNISSWADRDTLSVEDTFAEAVRTSAGSESIVSGEAAKIVSIVAKSNFAATAFRASGFNLLHDATAVGSGYYFLVPALPFGSFGTATKPNGILFTGANGENLKPTVHFKKLADGVPTGISDGTACAYTDSNGYRFYNTAEAGYIIVSDITFAQTCAHIGWSRRYDDFISPTASEDAGENVSLTSIIAAVHSYGLLLAIGSLADRIDFGENKATWMRKIDRVAPTWTTVKDSNGETATYTHSAYIAAMKSDGSASCGSLNLEVSGRTVKYTDDNATATAEYVYYELATPVAGSVTISPVVSIEDWGLEYLVGVSGEAYVTMQYAQSFPDSVAALVAGGLDIRESVVAQLIASLENRIAALEEMLEKGFGKLIVENLEVRNALDDFSTTGNANLSGEGAPAVIPAKIGQRYFDTTNKVWYISSGKNAVSDWKLFTNA